MRAFLSLCGFVCVCVFAVWAFLRAADVQFFLPHIFRFLGFELILTPKE